MITLAIRYTLDANKLADFAAYAKDLQPAIERCGGTLQGYYLPTKLAGPTNIGLALIDFPSLAAYEQYRALFGVEPDFIEADRIRDDSGCVLRYERTFMRPILPGHPA